jgi:hypothetical protein
MTQSPQAHSVEEHFGGRDATLRDLYDQLLAELNKFGPIIEDAKKTSIHLNHVSALAGISVRKTYLLVNIKSGRAIDSPRIGKSEQISARRFHHEVKLSSPDQIDAELLGWLREAYELSG